jgi:hypothetical protein
MPAEWLTNACPEPDEQELVHIKILLDEEKFPYRENFFDIQAQNRAYAPIAIGDWRGEVSRDV